MLVGSANINERSLLGDRDSELAVLSSDTAGKYNDIDGSGIPSPYRTFAHDLRKKIWAKLLGDAAGKYNDFLEQPAKAANWQDIRNLAIKNAKIYESVFDFIPRNYVGRTDDNDSYEDQIDAKAASIWPVFSSRQCTPEEAAKNMPFSADFWSGYNNDKLDILSNIKGYITLFPIHWTEGENNLVDYHVEIIN